MTLDADADSLPPLGPVVPVGRLAFARYEDGAVLLDLESGAFYRPNATAAQIAEGLAQGESVPEVAERLVRRFGVAETEAQRDVEAMIAELLQPRVVRGTNPITFEEGAEYLLRWNGQPFCRIEKDGGRVWDAVEGRADLPDSEARLLWTAPHLLALRGHAVLHASAIQTPEGVVAFCGPSGRGKTTLARLFADRGFRAVAEDLVVLRLAETAPEVVLGGEPGIRRWVGEQAPDLGRGVPVGIEGLTQVAQGATVPLRAVLFIERTAPPRPVMLTEPVGKAEGLVRLLENSFAELAQARLWRTVWESCQLVVRGCGLFQARVPDGLELLRGAVANYNGAPIG